MAEAQAGKRTADDANAKWRRCVGSSRRKGLHTWGDAAAACLPAYSPSGGAAIVTPDGFAVAPPHIGESRLDWGGPGTLPDLRPPLLMETPHFLCPRVHFSSCQPGGITSIPLPLPLRRIFIELCPAPLLCPCMHAQDAPASQVGRGPVRRRSPATVCCSASGQGGEGHTILRRGGHAGAGVFDPPLFAVQVLVRVVRGIPC